MGRDYIKQLSLLKNCSTFQQIKSFPPSVNRLSWQTLIRSSTSDLKRMVGGLENTAKVLNEYLVDLLLEKNDLVTILLCTVSMTGHHRPQHFFKALFLSFYVFVVLFLSSL